MSAHPIGPRRQSHIVVALTLATIVALLGVLARPSPPSLSTQVTGDPALAAMARPNLPGVRDRVSVATIDGDTVTYAHFGANNDTEYEIGSITKTVTSLERADGIWQVTTTSPVGGGVLETGMLVDASGRRSVVARREGGRRRTFDSQVAAVAFLDADADASPLHDASTMIEAAADGWWYAALLPSQQLAVAWFTDPHLLAASFAWHPAVWWELLRTSAIGRRLVAAHGYGMPERIRTLAAGSSLLTRPMGDGWVAAGDAAAAHDPLSSHGIGSALAGGRRAARAVVATLGGDGTAFAVYQERLLADYARYLWTRHAYYADERRWFSAPFWRRRHGNPWHGRT